MLIEAEGKRDVTLIGTGSELALAVEAAKALAKEGIKAAVVSMPCLRAVRGAGRELIGTRSWARLRASPSRLPSSSAGRNGLGAGGAFIGMHGFGASAPAQDLYKHFGITAEAVASAAKDVIGKEEIGTDMANKRVAINGFGRIGRLTFRAYLESGREDLDFVAINDLGSAEMNAHLLEFDSVHGRFRGKINVANGHLKTNGHDVAVLSEATPEKLPWRDLGVDIVMECTGRFTDRDGAAKHLTAGAKRVLVSAPCSGADLTVVFGVNDDKLTQEHHVVSNASCTTNCLAPVAQVLNEAVGIKHGYMTTIHAYTGDQRTVDTLHKDPYRARASRGEPDPDLDRRRQGGRPRAARAQGQARRRLDPRAGAECQHDRLDFPGRARDHRRGDQRRHGQGRQRAAQGHSRRERQAARLDRLQPRSLELDLRSRTARTWSTARSAGWCPGTTTNGASPTA